MAHFLYYAGKAYSYKLEKNKAKEFIEKHPMLFAFMSAWKSHTNLTHPGKVF